MAETVSPTQASIRLRPFLAAQADDIVGWVRSDDELRWLAPSTDGPLTPEKVCNWLKPNGLAFVAAEDEDSGLMAYGELNPMLREPSHFWIGHVIVRPDRRERGIGRGFVQSLVDYAFDALAATRLSLVVFPDNHGAIACYQRVGFSTIAEEFHRFGRSGPKHRLLRLELTSSA